MHVAGLYLPLVFAAGVASFASPCVLPLVPGYVAAVSGISVDELGSPPAFGRVARSSGWFFAGFLLVFLALGATASVIGELLASERSWLNRGAGVLIVTFGLVLAADRSGLGGSRWNAGLQRVGRRRGGPAVVGAAFALSWTPCVGPVLASVLALTGAAASLTTGVALLGLYGLGLAVPFVAVGFGFTRCVAALKGLRRHYRRFELAAGLVLVGMGVLLVTGRLFLLNAYAQRALEAAGLSWWSSL